MKQKQGILPLTLLTTSLVPILLTFFFLTNTITLFHPFLPYEDDAYIFLRYARNITQGYGIVWNPGEAPVEGYTSFLYLMLITSFRFLGITSERVLGWIGILSSTLSLMLTWRILQVILPKKYLVHAITIALIGFSPAFFYLNQEGAGRALFHLFTAAGRVHLSAHGRDKR